MATAFAVTANNVSATVGTAGYTHGATSLILTTGHGAKFPALTGSQFYRITVAQKANAYTPGAGSSTYTIFKATGLSADTFTGLTVIEGTSATNDFVSGDVVEVRITSQTLSDIHGAVNALEVVSSNNSWVSVDDYGAKGDGSTNDTVAIQNALNTGKNVRFGAVSTLSGTALAGTGTVFRAQAPAGTSIIFGFDSTNTAYSVSSVASDTSLTLGSSYTGSAVADPKTISLGSITTGISVAASQGAGNVVLNNMIGTAGVTTDISIGASTTVNVTAASVAGNYRTV